MPAETMSRREPNRHCERSEAIQGKGQCEIQKYLRYRYFSTDYHTPLDCFVAALLAMTV